MSAVGFAHRDPVEELRVAYEALKIIQRELRAIRVCMEKRDLREMDTHLVTAWQNVVEAKDRVAAVGSELKQK